ncbi:NAD(P)H-dependent oxidoreductase subunit E [Sulfobacillus harzensis]|uniref:NADH-quinone oxidoreductase subunit E n=1 Tax=Sulfobacillus harzensis TaxID=2729629 RepID=A0A7Y0L586_9FIRM|nr:NAD(P)H-dependent oxidoreductase subunit E [Sulfobacillus harzensis]NMP23293.1 hypothetical protein [Sulfobacillus harzensis]
MMLSKETEQQVAELVKDLPKERSSLLPALWAVVDHLGWIDDERTEAVAQALRQPVAEVYGVASFYALLPTKPKDPVRVCDDLLCRLKGSQDLISELNRRGIEAVSWPCLGRCEQAPAALLGPHPIVQATVDKVQAAQEKGE